MDAIEYPEIHRTVAAEHGKFIAPYYSADSNYCECSCGRTWTGKRAFIGFGTHQAMANRKVTEFARQEEQELIEVLRERDVRQDGWLAKACYRFTGEAPELDTDEDVRQAARRVLNHFAPSGDPEKDADRVRNGYTVTRDARQIRSIILRSFS